MKFFYPLYVCLFLSINSFSQETATEPQTLNDKFDLIYRTSDSYEIYKVIRKERFLTLKADVLDSVKSLKAIISEKENLLKSTTDTIQKLNANMSQIKTNLETATHKGDSISLFGLALKKTTYNIILWAVISLLLFFLILFIVKFKNSNVFTKEAKNNLLEVEREFEIYRKKALVKEQKLRRQLHDEMNKQRSS